MVGFCSLNTGESGETTSIQHPVLPPDPHDIGKSQSLRVNLTSSALLSGNTSLGSVEHATAKTMQDIARSDRSGHLCIPTFTLPQSVQRRPRDLGQRKDGTQRSDG